jgi:serine protease inhibitor
MRKLILVLLLLSGLSGLHCSKSTEPNPPNKPIHPTPINLTSSEKILIQSFNRFGFKLFQEVSSRENSGNNIFISPLSVSYALGMTANGAVGETRKAIDSALQQAGMPNEEINESYLNLTSLLTGLDPSVAFKIANSIWYQQGRQIQPNFRDLSETYFDALVKEIDFQASGTADTINDWVNVSTDEKIKEIIKPPLPPGVGIILMNAIYFKAAWTHLFDSSKTFDAKFRLADGSNVTCRMMFHTDTVRYFENELFQAADIPYGDGHFSMAIFMPTSSGTMESLIGQFTDENWATWRESFSERQMPFGLPRFKFEYSQCLNDMLKAMGMEIAFDPSLADFSGMFADGAGWIGQVRHKTFIQVDEQGTEAAAVTIIVMPTSSAGMTVNMPFIFVIYEHDSGAILFMGKIAKPEWMDG